MAFVETFKKVFGLPETNEFEDEYMEDTMYEEEDVEEDTSFRRNRFTSRRNDFSMKEESFEERKSSPVQMVLIKGKRFSDVERVAENLKQRRSVIINFEQMDSAEAQRTIDFLSGTTFAMNGSIQRVSKSTFIFAVGQVDLVGRIEDMKDKESYFSVK